MAADARSNRKAAEKKVQSVQCPLISLHVTRRTFQPSFEVGGVAISRRPGAGGGPVVRPHSLFPLVRLAYLLWQVRDPFGIKPKSQDAPRCALMRASFIAWHALCDLQLTLRLGFDA
jgi:hypothetical protein